MAMQNSGGFRRADDNSIAVVGPDGNPIGGGSGGSGGVVQMQLREGASWINVPGTATKGLLVEPTEGVAADGGALPGKFLVVAGSDGANTRSVKVSSAGVVQVDALSLPATAATVASVGEVRDRLPASLDGTDGGLLVHVQNPSAGGGGSGTEYTEGATDATITGQAMLWEDASDTLRAVSAAKPLPTAQQGSIAVTDGGGSLTVDGTVGVSGTVPVSDAGGSLTVDGSVGLTGSLPAGTNNIGDVDIITMPNVALDATTLAALETISVANFPSTYPVTDNGGSLTVDSTQLPGSLDADGGMKVHVQNGAAGTEYTEGNTDATITGSAILWEDASDTLRAVSAAKPLPVSQQGTVAVTDNGGSLTVDGGVSLSAPLPAGTNNIGDVDVLTLPAVALDSASLAALETIQIGNFPATQNVADGGGSLTVDGTVTANAGTGPWPVTDNGGSLTVDSAQLPTLVSGRLPVDGSAVTQPVSLAAVPTVTEKQDQPAQTSATWTSATGLNTAAQVLTTGYGTVTASIQVPSTVTAGVIIFEVSDDGTNFYKAGAVRVDNGEVENVVALARTPGIALNRMFSMSVDAMTHCRARLATVITGSGNVLVRLGTVAGGIEPFVATKGIRLATYSANFRATARPYKLSYTTVANTRKQFATIHHTASAVRHVKLKKVKYQVIAIGTAGEFNLELMRITTAPATGNPSITPVTYETGDSSAEAVTLAGPTTAGTETGAPLASDYFSLAATAAAPSTNPPPPVPWVSLYEAGNDSESKLPTLRAGVLEGFSATIDPTSAGAVVVNIWMEWTEELAS